MADCRTEEPKPPDAPGEPGRWWQELIDDPGVPVVEPDEPGPDRAQSEGADRA